MLCVFVINCCVWGNGLYYVLDVCMGELVCIWVVIWVLVFEVMMVDVVVMVFFFDGGLVLVVVWGVEWVRMSMDGCV